MKAYTYLIKHKTSGKFYYGVRYAKNCKVSDLFKIYFTSSAIVNKLYKEEGVSAFEWEIRKTFDNIDDVPSGWIRGIKVKSRNLKISNYLNNVRWRNEDSQN